LWWPRGWFADERGLVPELQSFEPWLAKNATRIPLG
jgi:hypothetical protein